jgi:hypothetical protein
VRVAIPGAGTAEARGGNEGDDGSKPRDSAHPRIVAGRTAPCRQIERGANGASGRSRASTGAHGPDTRVLLAWTSRVVSTAAHPAFVSGARAQ